MRLLPYGNINKTLVAGLANHAYVHNDPERPIATYRGSAAQYRAELNAWREDVRSHIWPEYTAPFTWTGGAEAHAEAATWAEVQICKRVFQDGGILSEVPKIGADFPQAEHRSQLWHYVAEDSGRPTSDNGDFDEIARTGPGANFLGYYKHDLKWDFATDFWYNKFDREPSVLAIKNWFQRPRPYTVACIFGMTEFGWHAARGITHTGVHPAFPSGHCYQGLIHSANVLQNRRRQGFSGDWQPGGLADTALKQYAVDWGDRRVFAGVHYPTDNIASWLFVLRVIERMFDDGIGMRDFVVDAITNYSRVYKLIQDEFPRYEELQPAYNLLMSRMSFEGEVA